MKKITILLILLLTVASVFGQTVEEPPLFSNARIGALGGNHAALADDIMTIFNNPAGVSLIESKLLISQITFGMSGPIFDMASALLSGDPDPMANTSLISLVGSMYSSIDIVGPISFAYAGNGLSIGFFNWGDVRFESRGNGNIDMLIRENVLITGGFSFPIPINKDHRLDIGFQLKALLRGAVDAQTSVLDIFGAMMSDPTSLVFLNPFVFSVAGGADLGIIYSLSDIFSAGIAVRNVYTPVKNIKYVTFNDFLNGVAPPAANTTDGIIPLDLSAGVKVNIPLGFLERYISDVIVMFDYVDILDFLTQPATAKHWILHMNLGMELKLLEVLAIRCGFSQGFLSAGIGFDLSLFKLDVSMFGKELSSIPGMRPAYNLVVGLEFSM